MADDQMPEEYSHRVPDTSGGSPYNWDQIKLHWIGKNLEQGRTHKYTFLDLSKELGIPEAKIRERAYSKKLGGTTTWTQELDQMRDKKVKRLNQAMIEREAFNELKFRSRSITLANRLEAIALKKLKQIEDSDVELLSFKEALDAVRLAFTLKERAVGFSEDFNPFDYDLESGERLQSAVIEDQHMAFRKLLERFGEYVATRKKEEVEKTYLESDEG